MFELSRMSAHFMSQFNPFANARGFAKSFIASAVGINVLANHLPHSSFHEGCESLICRELNLAVGQLYRETGSFGK
jgi:hypothetical protein